MRRTPAGREREVDTHSHIAVHGGFVVCVCVWGGGGGGGIEVALGSFSSLLITCFFMSLCFTYIANEEASKQ